MISTQSISTHDWDRETADDQRCLHSHAPIKRNTSCICTYVYLYGLYKLGQVAGKAIASSFPAIYLESFSLSFSINFPLSLIFDKLFSSPSLIFNKLSALSLSRLVWAGWRLGVACCHREPLVAQRERKRVAQVPWLLGLHYRHSRHSERLCQIFH